MNRDDRSTRTTRRHVLGVLGTAATTAVAGCGYREAAGDPVWRQTETRNNTSAAGDLVLLSTSGIGDTVEGASYVNVLDAATGRAQMDVYTEDSAGAAILGDEVLYFTTEGERLLVDDEPVTDTNGTDAVHDELFAIDGTDVVRRGRFEIDVNAVAEGPETTYVVTHDGLVALEKGGGRRFSVAYPWERVYGLGVAASADGCAVLTGETAQRVVAIAPDGAERWRTDARFAASATVEMVENAVFVHEPPVPEFDVEPAMTAFDATSGEPLSFGVPTPHDAVVPTNRGDVYVVSAGVLYAVDVAERRVRWRFPAEQDSPLGVPKVSGPPVHTADSVVVPTDGKTHELAATDGAVRWRRRFPEQELVGAFEDRLVVADPGLLVGRRR
ncbi:PQQ-binding-like beta-propeller repeat protein [Halorubellus litoreus]|uniref:PQQ-binding-like beta-propeller repeat protein n=1 Tax=Halorubellus litoreus TaxID=755308 RepID=A0ABD5VQP1_9EURY